MNAQVLAASLDTPSGFTAVMKGMFRNGKAKKAHAPGPPRSVRACTRPSSCDPNDHTVSSLGDPHPGVYVFVAVTSPKGPDRPLVAHCVADGKDWIYPVPGDRLR